MIGIVVLIKDIFKHLQGSFPKIDFEKNTMSRSKVFLTQYFTLSKSDSRLEFTIKKINEKCLLPYTTFKI